LRRRPLRLPPLPHPLREAAEAEEDVVVVAAVAPPQRPGLLRLHLLLQLRLRVMLRLLPLLQLSAVVEEVEAAVAEAVVETRPLPVAQPLRFPGMLRLPAALQVVDEAAGDAVVEALLLRIHRRQRQRAPLLKHCKKPILLEFSGRRRAPVIPSSTPIR
jgi:hypothetical protein